MKITPIKGNCETEGVPFVYRGVTLIVARAGNTEFKKVFREAMKPFKDEFENDRMTEEQSNKLMIECIAKGILVGWETFTDMDGVEQEYSTEAAIELLTDDKDCYDAIMDYSQNIENYLTTSEEDLKVK
jgi:hypothetical protein